MDITASPDIPCVELNPLSGIPSIPLLGGAELNAFPDVSGAPTDCELHFNLLLQLGPLFASMACLFKILDVIGKLGEFAGAVPNLPKMASKAGELVDAIGKLEACMPPLQIPNLLAMLKHILELILSYLGCVLERIDSILEFRAGIDLGAADGNPALQHTLQCAQNSADAAMGNVMLSLKPLQPLMAVVQMIAGIAGQSLSLPDFSAMSEGADKVEETVATLKSAVQGLQGIVDSLPG